VFHPKTALDKTYEIGILIKGADGVLELIGAALLALASPHAINQLTQALTQHELSEDPHDFVATHILNAGQHLASGGTMFAVAYLAIHGATKVVLVWALLKDKLWAYPASLGVLGLFVVYQVYKVALGHSVGLTLLTLFDLFVIWLIWREWQQRLARGKPAV
jgi:uncharacterized membrane protein